ncbi:segregation and condensation protein B [Inhella inkyongensis]|uniref:Segregation and condensation protein B n=1 Tax=Inhella inkyongensis TaxID=392593 RepID=A0A840S5G5_9BURK|nr:SMC-Scp complex subunit ScpB [Inhella inkyongensis]MBB5203729.1 segregation and condensation protein B [Inhella inkyongensis]
MQACEAKSILEAALLCAAQAMTLKDMQQLLGGEMQRESLLALLRELQQDWADRGLELRELAQGWRFQTRLALRPHLERLHPERPQRYSRAAMETLAVIAYRQPVTRGDIEDIRGVVVSAQIMRQLEDRGWVESIGHREAPGRPALFATTRQFLADLGLRGLDELPALEGFALPELAPEQVSLLAEAEAVAAADGMSPINPPTESAAPQGAAQEQTAEPDSAEPLNPQDLEVKTP